MSYSDFTLSKVKQEFGLKTIEDLELFPNTGSYQVPEELSKYLKRYSSLALSINTEKARSEYMIAPILGEIWLQLKTKISLFSGIELNVDSSLGINGRCDYIISLSNEQFFLTAPIIMLVEAKNNDIKEGLGQCIAEMLGAQKFNEQNKVLVPQIYGVVTTGSLWRFLKLQEKTIYIDINEYSLQILDKLMWIFATIVEQYHVK